MKKYKVIMIIEASIIIILAIILSTLYFNKNSLCSKTNNSIYDTFTEREIEQMRYSKLACFSLTTDFNASNYTNVQIGDEFTIQYKLTNMTEQELEVNIMAGHDSSEQVASLASYANINPVATGDIHTYVFKPYETIILTSHIKVDSDDIIQDGAYILCSSVLLEMLNNKLTYSDNCYFSISMEDMYLFTLQK